MIATAVYQAITTGNTVTSTGTNRTSDSTSAADSTVSSIVVGCTANRTSDSTGTSNADSAVPSINVCNASTYTSFDLRRRGIFYIGGGGDATSIKMRFQPVASIKMRFQLVASTNKYNFYRSR